MLFDSALSTNALLLKVVTVNFSLVYELTSYGGFLILNNFIVNAVLAV